MLEYPRRPPDEISVMKAMPRVENGYIHPNDAPGFGVTLNEALL